VATVLVGARALLAEVIGAGQAVGAVRAEVDAQGTAGLLVATVLGVLTFLEADSELPLALLEEAALALLRPVTAARSPVVPLPRC
jgi:hypothetical protein